MRVPLMYTQSTGVAGTEAIAVGKSETINLRMDSTTRAVIARAAEASGKTLTAFMTEAAYRAAEAELLDQRYLGLEASVFDTVEALIDSPLAPNAALRRLMQTNPNNR